MNEEKYSLYSLCFHTMDRNLVLTLTHSLTHRETKKKYRKEILASLQPQNEHAAISSEEFSLKLTSFPQVVATTAKEKRHC